MVCVCGLHATFWIKRTKTLISVHIHAFIFSKIMKVSKFFVFYFKNITHIYIYIYFYLNAFKKETILPFGLNSAVKKCLLILSVS